MSQFMRFVVYLSTLFHTHIWVLRPTSYSHFSIIQLTPAFLHFPFGKRYNFSCSCHSNVDLLSIGYTSRFFSLGPINSAFRIGQSIQLCGSYLAQYTDGKMTRCYKSLMMNLFLSSDVYKSHFCPWPLMQTSVLLTVAIARYLRMVQFGLPTQYSISFL